MNKEELLTYIRTNCPNICQIVAYKGSVKVLDEAFNGYTKDDCTHIMSATKSIVSLLMGIALDKGYVQSLDDKVLSYFPSYKTKRGEHTIQEVTIRHLMTMRAPYKCKGDPWTKVCTSEDWSIASLDFLGGRAGLTDEFKYQTVCLHILCGILENATGMNTIDFANKYLFEPLGIDNRVPYCAKDIQEHKEFTISKLPRKKVWFSDPRNSPTAGYGLCMNANEMAAIGLLCLNKGLYEGKRVVSESYIEQMTRPRIVESSAFRGMKYGLLWWIVNEDKGIYSAIGNSGNVIYINPKDLITVSVSSYFKPAVFDRIDFIQKYIEPFCLNC